MGWGGPNKVTSKEHVVVGSEVTRVADAHSFKEAAVCAQNIVTSGAVGGGLTGLPPCLRWV
jgi:hypothetical protein